MRLFAPFMESTRLAFACKSPIRFAISIRYNWTQGIVSLEGELAVGLGVKVAVEVVVEVEVEVVVEVLAWHFYALTKATLKYPYKMQISTYNIKLACFLMILSRVLHIY